MGEVYRGWYYGDDDIDLTQITENVFGAVFGDGGDDRIIGTDADDMLYGGVGGDELNGADGADLLVGDQLNDSLIGGHDTIRGGAGNDQIDGGAGDDQVYGDDGNDLLISGEGYDEVFGGSGNDSIHGGAGNDTLIGGIGDDQIYGADGYDIIDGGEGTDTADYSNSSFALTAEIRLSSASPYTAISSPGWYVWLDQKGAATSPGDNIFNTEHTFLSLFDDELIFANLPVGGTTPIIDGLDGKDIIDASGLSTRLTGVLDGSNRGWLVSTDGLGRVEFQNFEEIFTTPFDDYLEIGCQCGRGPC